jgi:predicted Zn-dependent protease with MMP-like domain
MSTGTDEGRFESYVQDALDALPPDIAEMLDNVALVIEDEPPPDDDLLGHYHGVPHTSRSSSYGGVLPDLITIYRGPLERYYGHDERLLRAQVRRTVLHEIAHHFGISDERLVEIDRY